MEGLRVGLFIFLFEIVGLSLFWLMKCLLTRRLFLISEKINTIFDLIKYVGRYWYDVFCIVSYGVCLAGKATVRFFWIVGVIVGDSFRKIGYAARATVEIIRLIIKLSKQRHANKKVAFYQMKTEALRTSEYSDFNSEKYA